MINIIKGKGLYQNKVNSSLVCTRHYKMNYCKKGKVQHLYVQIVCVSYFYNPVY